MNSLQRLFEDAEYCRVDQLHELRKKNEH